jgi:alpha-glucoside transport system substrate-binding protein
MMRRLRWVVPLAVLVLIAVACTNNDEGGGGGTGGASGPAQEENTGSVNVLSALDPAEADTLQTLWDKTYGDSVDYQVEFEGSDQFEEQLQIRSQAGTLDTILLPQPGAVIAQAQTGNALSLEDLGYNIDDLNATFGDYYMSLGEYQGQHYGLPTNSNYKSLIWYPKKAFDDAGYEIPKTWDELMALSDQIVADGGTPWCVGFESGTATGWPATDWVEDIMLATAGQEKYSQWVSHEIPFTDPAVKNAVQMFGDVMFKPGYVLGGADQTPSIAFGDAPLPMFDNPPKCWLHRQATFINAFFPKGTEYGVDYAAFPFPTIDQQGGLFAGEIAMAYRNAPEIKDFFDKFSGTEFQCAMAGDPGLSRLSPNVNVKPDCYSNPVLADSVALVQAALTGEGGVQGGFDASDQMPPEVGQGSFWTGMVDYMKQGPDSLDGILQQIDDSWPSG